MITRSHAPVLREQMSNKAYVAMFDTDTAKYLYFEFLLWFFQN